MRATMVDMPAPTRASLGLAALVAASVLLVGSDAHAQFICANFFPRVTGTYADRVQVTVSGTTTIDSEHGVEGFRLGAGSGTQCATYDLDQRVARFDVQIVGVDPGERSPSRSTARCTPSPASSATRTSPTSRSSSTAAASGRSARAARCCSRCRSR